MTSGATFRRSPHQVVKLIETTAGEPSNGPTGPGYHHDKSDRLVLESKETWIAAGWRHPTMATPWR